MPPKLILLFTWILIMGGCSTKTTDDKSNSHAQNLKDQQKTAFEKKIVTERNNQTQALLESAIKLLNQKKLPQSIELFRLVMRIAPYDPRPYYYLAETFMRLNHFDDALKVLEDAGQYHTDIAKIMEYLEASNQNLPQTQETETNEKVWIAQFKDNKKCAFAFNFDDGAKNVYTKVLPLFESYGYRASIMINPGLTTDSEDDPWHGTWTDWKDAIKRGFEIGNHTINHRDITKLPDDQLDKEVNGSYDLIKEKLGIEPLSFVFPNDSWSLQAIKKVLERHYIIRLHDYMCQLYPKSFIPVYGGQFFTEKTAERIVNLAITHNLWVVPECHAIKDTTIRSHKPLTEEFLKAHLNYLRKNDDKVWVDTFLNTYLYLIERKMSRVFVEPIAQNYLKVAVVSPFKNKIYRYPLTVVINTSPQKATKAEALEEESGKPIPVKIEDNLILLTVIPNASPTVLRWE